MKRTICILIASTIVISCILLSSCNKETETAMEVSDYHYKSKDDKEYILLGEQLNDPYNISFMKMAFDRLKDSGFTFPFSEIMPTGQYIRLLANSTEELDIIESDSTTLWFDFPLDYELLEGGTSYHDVSLPDSATWKYAVVPMNYNFPDGITKEHLHDVFIPDEHADYEKYKDAFDKMEELSEMLCNNKSAFTEDDTSYPSPKKNEWSPSATIQAWDDVVNGFIPLEGVKVTARRYTKSRSRLTNARGTCTFAADFKKKVKYGITWESKKWDIRDGWWQAYYNGPTQKSSWNLYISGQNKSLMYATIHRAAWKAYYGYFGDLTRPSLVVGKMKISYKHKKGDQNGMHYSGWHVFGLVSDIYIWGYDNGGYRKTNRVFGTTLHELAHQSHQRFMGTFQFWNVSEYVCESWARAVQCILTNQHYREELAINERCLTHNELNSVQYYIKEIYGAYTPLFIDLVDDYNQATYLGSSYIDDRVSGYTLKEIQDHILCYAYGFPSTKTRLKALKRHGETDDDIDKLFEQY